MKSDWKPREMTTFFWHKALHYRERRVRRGVRMKERTNSCPNGATWTWCLHYPDTTQSRKPEVSTWNTCSLPSSHVFGLLSYLADFCSKRSNFFSSSIRSLDHRWIYLTKKDIEFCQAVYSILSAPARAHPPLGKSEGERKSLVKLSFQTPREQIQSKSVCEAEREKRESKLKPSRALKLLLQKSPGQVPEQAKWVLERGKRRGTFLKLCMQPGSRGRSHVPTTCVIWLH